MEGPPDAPSIISSAELSELARLLDAFENALDPMSAEAKTNRIAFNQRVQNLYETRVKPQFASIESAAFRAHVRLRCLKLIANEDKPPTV